MIDCKPKLFPSKGSACKLQTMKKGRDSGRLAKIVLYSRNPVQGEEGILKNSLKLKPKPNHLPTPPPARPGGSSLRKSPMKWSPSGDILCHSARSPAALALGLGRHLPSPRPPSLPPLRTLQDPSPRMETTPREAAPL